MGHAKEILEPLTTNNAMQCDKCNHIFDKKVMSTYDISWYQKSCKVNLCKECARNWFNQVNKRYHFLDEKETIFADNLDEVSSENE